MIQASIITIGDELLIGQVIDTNSAFIAQQLNMAGFQIARRVAVADEKQAIRDALDEEPKHADIIVITGGLGPTADDITKPLLREYFGGKMIEDAAALKNVIYLFEEIFKRAVTDRNRRQAEVPDNCIPIQNSRGTAPGMIFSLIVDDREKVFISLPGVPHEMQAMMTLDVIPFLQKKFTPGFVGHRTLLTAGIGESMLADRLQDFEDNLPGAIKMAYLPNSGMVRLRLTATGERKLETTLDQHFGTLQKLVADVMVTAEDEPLEKVIGKLLVSKGQSVCTAESCTGGYIASLLTSVPGSSAYFDGSVVSYSYKAKEDLLQVQKQTLETEGAVSEDVVRQMAAGALKNIGSDFAIAVSGIMGPGGGMPGKPVGTVWIAVANQKTTRAKKFEFRFDRERNVRQTAMQALLELRKLILEAD